VGLEGERRVWVFFYGSFINPDVLAAAGVVPQRVEVARLSGFDISIGPLANLVRSDRDSVYGIVVQATHTELDRLYSQSWVGTYLPEAVLTETADGRLLPALCYVAPEGDTSRPTREYVDRIVAPASAYGFPAWYIQRLTSFRPPA
jgi:cation transport regulator ChaC